MQAPSESHWNAFPLLASDSASGGSQFLVKSGRQFGNHCVRASGRAKAPAPLHAAQVANGARVARPSEISCSCCFLVRLLSGTLLQLSLAHLNPTSRLRSRTNPRQAKLAADKQTPSSNSKPSLNSNSNSRDFERPACQPASRLGLTPPDGPKISISISISIAGLGCQTFGGQILSRSELGARLSAIHSACWRPFKGQPSKRPFNQILS